MGWQAIGAGAATRVEPLHPIFERASAEPTNARVHGAVGLALLRASRHAEAEAAFERALSLAGSDFCLWEAMATAVLDGRGPEALLSFCAERWHGSGDASWHYFRARGLRRARRRDEARAEFLCAIELGDPRHRALRRLLGMTAGEGDGAALLRVCDTLPGSIQHSSQVRAHRALALSQLGRTDEAAALVDLDGATMRFAFQPPPEFGSLAAFNDALAARLLEGLPLSLRDANGAANYRMSPEPGSELAAIAGFIRQSYGRYLARIEGRSGVPGLPSTLDGTRFSCGAVVLRGEGRNGQHIHPGALLTGVYHVQVPHDMRKDGEGDLLTGVCDQIAPGHMPCWGVRRIKPEPGMLTIFPAHFFHDVAPTGSDLPRISIVSDLARV